MKLELSGFTVILILFQLQHLYQTLLQAESEGILENVNMTQVEKLILDPDMKKY